MWQVLSERVKIYDSTVNVKCCGNEMWFDSESDVKVCETCRKRYRVICHVEEEVYDKESAVKDAREKKVCRICGLPGEVFKQGDSLVFNFGKEYAHQSCLEKEKT